MSTLHDVFKDLTAADVEARNRRIAEAQKPGLSLAQRRELSRAQQANQQAMAEKILADATEKESHRIYGQWLQTQGIRFIEARMDMRSTIAEGWPDFSVFCRAKTAVFVELKMPGGRLSKEQVETLEYLKQQGFAVTVAYSAQEAIDWTAKELLR